jgi:hypothetical protein
MPDCVQDHISGEAELFLFLFGAVFGQGKQLSCRKLTWGQTLR